jgi:hypothetical protein
MTGHGYERDRTIDATPDQISDDRDSRPPMRWRLSNPAVLATLTFVLGGVLGYLIGVGHAPVSGPSVTPATADPFPTVAALRPTDTTCNWLPGTPNTLQVGIEVSNDSGGPLILNRIEPIFPLGGLRATASQWGDCAATGVDGATPLPLAANALTWITVTLAVNVVCPAPLPVQFTIGYLRDGKPGVVNLNGFADLGDIPYPGCPNFTPSA